jgi:endonuclease III
MTKKERYQYILEYFAKETPNAETELLYDNPFQLLVAVILSAQCTDKRINLTTPAIFKQFSTPKSLSLAQFEEVFALIKSISYPNNKAKHLIGMAQMLQNNYAGNVPMTVEELIKLPGVGRKTANVITSVIDKQPNMAVDTHVNRVSKRLGLVPKTATTPLAVEKHLIKYIPENLVHKAHHWLILHGRYVCKARNPKCTACQLRQICTFFRNTTKR